MSAKEHIEQIKEECDNCKSCPDGHLHQQVAYLLRALEAMERIAVMQTRLIEIHHDGRTHYISEEETAIYRVNEIFEKEMNNERDSKDK